MATSGRDSRGSSDSSKSTKLPLLTNRQATPTASVQQWQPGQKIPLACSLKIRVLRKNLNLLKHFPLVNNVIDDVGYGMGSEFINMLKTELQSGSRWECALGYFEASQPMGVLTFWTNICKMFSKLQGPLEESLQEELYQYFEKDLEGLRLNKKGKQIVAATLGERLGEAEEVMEELQRSLKLSEAYAKRTLEMVNNNTPRTSLSPILESQEWYRQLYEEMSTKVQEMNQRDMANDDLQRRVKVFQGRLKEAHSQVNSYGQVVNDLKRQVKVLKKERNSLREQNKDLETTLETKERELQEVKTAAGSDGSLLLLQKQQEMMEMMSKMSANMVTKDDVSQISNDIKGVKEELRRTQKDVRDTRSQVGSMDRVRSSNTYPSQLLRPKKH